MTRTLVNLALGASLAMLASPSDVFAGRGGGRGGGYSGGGGGGARGGGYSGGGGGYGGGSMGHSPSFSQPRPSTNESRPQGAGASGNRNQSGNPSNAGAAAAGAGYSNRNQGPSNAGAAAAGAGYSNRNQSGTHSNAGAAAAGADYSNRNQSGAHSNAGAAAAGADYSNRNQNPYSNAGAAAAGAGYANRNQIPYSNAGAAAVGAGYANRNQYDQYHPSMTNGYWNGNYGAMGMGSSAGVGAWGVGSPMYGYGYSGYSNPYATGMAAPVAGQPVGQPQPADGAASAPASAPDYTQPLNTAAAAPQPTVTDQATALFDQAREAFKSNDYATALQRDQQAIGQMPNDSTMHEFLALVFFAQGKYDQAAGPLYAVLSVGPGWDWTTLIGNYSDANLYTEQVRNLEAFVKADHTSAPARFLLAYHYITQGHNDSAAVQLKEVVALQPNDTLSAQLLSKLQPASAGTAAPSQARPVDAGKLTGDWNASAPQNAKVTLSIKDDGGFTWTIAAPGKPPTSISGKSTLADGTLTLSADQKSQMGALTGQVARLDDTHFNFRANGAPANDPGLAFAR
ncbi:MAG: hypothetical protein P4L85_28950 [Paludisphaera borealis]|uniref:tetratricopeptide repeat protein n=1 Tax=Paludisphaera borealis TaxID=1387353 RepID=UPI00284B8567|nr:hypothetical protein [Paludisphaera borealis]MDR3623396.1 hypothetical protein [Paludisphaera borealis]